MTTLTPHLQFYGNCEEALKTYQDVLNGTYEIVQRNDRPGVADEEKSKIMYSVFKFDDNTLFMNDVTGGPAEWNGVNPTAMSLNVESSDKAQHMFDKLSEGGRVVVPFGKQFWGGWHGNFTDRFGVRWMINCAE